MLWRLFLARVCVTVQAWGRAVLCPSGQRSIVAIYACALTCGRSFTVCSGWGVLSFWSFLVFSSPYYGFFLQHRLPQFFGVFLRAFVFFVGSLEAVCFRRTLLPIFHVCWLVSFVVSNFLSMPTTSTSYVQQPLGGLVFNFFHVSPSIFWGFSGRFDCGFGNLEFSF